jgi:hypothetical protein
MGDKLVAAGDFQQAGSLSISNIACWNGSSWESLGSGLMPGPVYALIVADGTLVAGASFELDGCDWKTGVAQWNGSHWVPIGECFYEPVHAFAQFEGDLIAATQSSIFRLSEGSWSALGWSSLHGRIAALTVHNGALLAGGDT